jgi:LacI family transcriptional regulator
MIGCPYCGSSSQVKAGRDGERQRYKCSACQRRYLADRRGRGYPAPLRQQALTLHGQGISIGAISRRLGISGQSIRNWLRTGNPPSMQGEKDIALIQSSTTATADTIPKATKKRPTIDDVARQAGVSRSTVSNILNSKGRMSETTRGRVQAAMDDLHFTPSALIRAIHRQHTRILGVLIFGLDTLDQNLGASLSPHLLAGISGTADAAGCNILLYTGWDTGAGRHAALEFLDGHIDGLIWVAPALHEPALERLAEAGLPVIALLSCHVPDGIGYVNADNIGGIRDIVTALGALGHRRIAYIGSSQSSNFLDRRTGYRAGLAALGLEYDARLEVMGERSPEMFRAAVTAWLALLAAPTAIVTPNDGWAEEIGAVICETGLRIPDDISVTGFNDNLDAQRILGGLTTSRQPFRQMGQIATERLLALIEGTPVSDCRLTVPTELILRASTAAPR